MKSMQFTSLMKKLAICTLSVLLSALILSSCAADDSAANDNHDTSAASTQSEDDNPAPDSQGGETVFSITDYDTKPQGDVIGVYYAGDFYGWVSQIRNEDEINSYIAQAEYIGESKEKQITGDNSPDEPVAGLDDWTPDSDLECNGLNAGTPLYKIDNYILAVYDTPVETDSLTLHEGDGNQEDLPLYVYGHIYRTGDNS